MRSTSPGVPHLRLELSKHASISLDHLEEVLMIHKSLENRSECKAVMAAEGSRKPEDGYVVRQGGGRERVVVGLIGVAYGGRKMRE